VAFGVGACARFQPPPSAPLTGPGFALEAVSFASLSGWVGDAQSGALKAFARSCSVLTRRPADTRSGKIGTVRADWRQACAAAERVPRGDDRSARAFFAGWFTPYAVLGDEGRDGTFTGYYEAELKGSWTRHDSYRTPIYARPDDLVGFDPGKLRESQKGARVTGGVADGRLIPNPSRAEIDAGALADRGLEILWVDDAVDAFFLHIQGSGRVVMEDGAVVRLGFAAKNGHPYTAIGRELIAEGVIEAADISMQTIRAWLADNPSRAPAMMARNASYIFFRRLAGEGPLGAQGVPLTPGRSLAVDPRYVPLGAPVWIDTVDPVAPDEPLRRLAVAQDTGSAIVGPVRGDLFWGFGEWAAMRAGRMKGRGRLFVLLPRDAVPAVSP
jgi:membrane-bound lytic murein transglycosylase A